MDRRRTRSAGAFRRGLVPAILLIGVNAAEAQAPDIAGKAALCAACHGAAGVPVSKDIPVIWGQHAGYVFIELRDFASGARKSDIMGPVAKGLSRGDMLAVAEYLEQKPWPNLGQSRAPAEATARAESVATSGQCTQCHLGGYLGDSTNPRLAGQSVTYLRTTMLAFHTGARANNPWMSALLKTYTEADIEALSAYLGGL